MRFSKLLKTSIFIFGFFLCLNINAWAVPKLQLYIPDATYDLDTETWVFPGLEYDLWAIGADPSASDGTTLIKDVTIAAAVKSGQTGSISIQPYLSADTLGISLTGIFWADSTPVKGDGKALPSHDIYPSDWYEFKLGDFLLNEVGIPDFDENYNPETPQPSNAYGLISKYHVTVTGAFDWVHFDLYDHIAGENKALFAPFSHDADAEDGGGSIPEPATMLLLGSGLIGLAGFSRKKFKT